MRITKGMPEKSAKSWTRNMMLTHVPRTERIFSIIDSCWDLDFHNGGKGATDLFVDISQNIGQGVHSQGLIRTATTSQELYSFGQDRLVFGQEYLNFLGFGEAVLTGLSLSQVRDLYGEAFAIPVVTLLATALLLFSPSTDLWDRS